MSSDAGSAAGQALLSDSSSMDNAPLLLQSPVRAEEPHSDACNGEPSLLLPGGFVSSSFTAPDPAVDSSPFRGLLRLSSPPSSLALAGLEASSFHGENACNGLRSSLACKQPKENVYGNNYGGCYGGCCSPTVAVDATAALHKFLSSNSEDESWPLIDVCSGDEFRMYDFKVRKCMRGRSHDWTECPFVHPGEKARRRDPLLFHYSGTACSEFRKGCCTKGDACEYAHGVFECWLHPSRYRTQPCKDGKNCRRRVCFFAHTSEQLRVLPGSSQLGDSSSSRAALQSLSSKDSFSGCYDGSPLRKALAGGLDRGFFWDGSMGKISYGGPCGSAQMSSPTSTLVGHSQSPPSISPPPSPPGSPPCWNAIGLPYIVPLQNVDSSQSQAPIVPGNVNFAAFTSSFPPSPAVVGHRCHLERINPMLSVSIPTIEVGDVDSSISPGSISSDKGASHVMGNLLTSIQKLELGARTGQSIFVCSPRVSLLYPNPISPSSVPRKCMWGLTECEAGPQLERVESGRDLRAKIYGRLSKENPLENDSLDLDWVNELMK